MIPTAPPGSLLRGHAEALGRLATAIPIYSLAGDIGTAQRLGFMMVDALDTLLEAVPTPPVLPMFSRIDFGAPPPRTTDAIPFWSSQDPDPGQEYTCAWLTAALTLEIVMADGQVTAAAGHLLTMCYRAGLADATVEIAMLAATHWARTLATGPALAEFHRRVPGVVMCLNMHHMVVSAQAQVADFADLRRASAVLSADLLTATEARFPDLLQTQGGISQPSAHAEAQAGHVPQVEIRVLPFWPSDDEGENFDEVPLDIPGMTATMWVLRVGPDTGHAEQGMERPNRDLRIALDQWRGPTGQAARRAYGMRWGIDRPATMSAITDHVLLRPRPLGEDEIAHLALAAVWRYASERGRREGVGLADLLTRLVSTWSVDIDGDVVDGASVEVSSALLHGAAHVMVWEFMTA